MKKPKCRFCDADASKQSVKGDFVYGGRPEHKFWYCNNCQMIYLYPLLTEEEENFFYKKEFEKYMAERGARDKDWTAPEKHFLSNQGEKERRMRVLDKHLSNNQKILEIGCSSGFMLYALKEKGHDVTGIDPSEGFIDFVKSKGISVYGNLSDLKNEHSHAFDLIIHYYVLEHIRNPSVFIETYMGQLNDNGKMIFEVPCASDPLIELYGIPAFDKFYWSIAHHWYFNKDSMTALLEKTGYKFQLIPEQRYDISNHITWMLDGKPGGYGRFSHIFESDLDEMYKEKLKTRWLCDTIVAIIEK